MAGSPHPAVNRGPWTHRLLIYGFTALFALLVYWLLGFVVRDIGTWPGPDYQQVQAKMVDSTLVQTNDTLKRQIADTNRDITSNRERQRVLRDSTTNSERTMNQLLELQRLTLQKGNQAPSPEEVQALAESQKLFLENQRRYEEINERIRTQTDELQSLEARLREVAERIQAQSIPANLEFQRLLLQHQLKLAAAKIAVLLPVLALAAWLFLRKRNTLYAPLIYALGIAVLAKALAVLHEHFPARYFKYLIIIVGLVLVTRILVYLLRMVAFPKRDWLIKQYREAYDHFVCPVCSYPVRRGPMKYLAWSRRGIRKLSVLPENPNQKEEPYTCPVCATPIYEDCAACHNIRHSLLPICTHCGAKKDIPVPN